MLRVLTLVAVVLSSLCFPACAQQSLQKQPDNVYVCTFNIYLFGQIEPKYSGYESAEEVPDDPDAIPQRIVNLANVLAVGGFDLVVIEELDAGEAGAWALADLQTELRESHGLDYTAFSSDVIGPGFSMDEKIGFLYDADVIQPVMPTGATSLTVNLPVEGARALVRSQWEAGSLDFTLIAGHLEWGDPDGRRRGFELIEEILTSPTPSGFSVDPDIVVLGDFNRFGDGQEGVEALEYEPGDFLAPNVAFFDPEVHTKKSVTKSSILGRGVPDDNPQFVSTTVATNTMVYDMLLLTMDLAEEFPPGTGDPEFGVDFGVIPFDELGGFGHQAGAELLAHDPLKRAYSDHRPLWFRLRTDLVAHDDHTPAGLASVAFEVVGTPSGSKFHRPGCSTLRNPENVTESWTSRDAALADGRGPCGVCNP